MEISPKRTVALAFLVGLSFLLVQDSFWSSVRVKAGLDLQQNRGLSVGCIVGGLDLEQLEQI